MGNINSGNEEINRDICVKYRLLPLVTGSNANFFNKKIYDILDEHNIHYEFENDNIDNYFWCPYIDRNFQNSPNINWRTGKCPFIKLTLPHGYRFVKDKNDYRFYYLNDNHYNNIFTIFVKICSYDNFSYNYIDNYLGEIKCHHDNYVRIVNLHA
ncbi:hypothetical protein QKC54_gp0143 [Megavirus baoshan]|uniref:Uncharacterized protein n=1 Tax=Megavirus baoshan TaxID=2496520 RepID=A0A3S8UYH7_9VIRU|nr:hypothetical protein QKC54_gp0143 [Megavirus baoshan]AZL89773.1 hypothetical protein Mb0929 [Megavirus baoshan]